MTFSFDLIQEDERTAARVGVIHTTHGDIPTPAFAPVGTLGTVKTMTPADLRELGTTLILANTYHLYLRPGPDLVARMGGLHRFMGWDGPVLTDSGGFQVFSLAGLRQVSDEEVKVLVQLLHHWFTDEPESVIVTDREKIDKTLPPAVKTVNSEGGTTEKAFILSRLAEIALADGALMDAEGALILQVAEQLEMPSKQAYAIMVGAAQAVGFKKDVRLNEIARNLRRSLRIGLGVSNIMPEINLET